MRFATSSIIAVLCASTANAQIAGATKLVADVTKLTTDLTAVPPNTGVSTMHTHVSPVFVSERS